MAETERVSSTVGGNSATGREAATQQGNGLADTPEELPQEIQQIIQERDESQELSLDEIFELLKNERRRKVISYLLDNEEGQATLSDLAEYIAAMENDIEVRELSSDQRKRVYVGLYQCHLPKMDDMDVIDFNSNRGTVKLNSTVSQLQPYLESINETPENDFPLFEVVITLGVLIALVPAFLGIGPIAAMSPIVWASISTAALIAVSLSQIARVR